MEESGIIIETAIDWWTFGATIFAGILTAIMTYIAVVYTNKKTVELYERDKEYQNKRDNMVIIKPTIKCNCFFSIIEELILFNIRDRVLLISSDAEGFDFFDDNTKNNQNHRIFSIKNESKKDIHSVKIDIKTILKTSSDAKIEDHFSNIVNLLRGNEEIIVRMHNTKQRDKIWEELDKNNQTTLSFDCVINYLTSANEQVRYNFEAEIINIPEKKIEEDRGEIIYNNAKISIVKDEYKVLEKRTLKESMTTSVYRNMQDSVTLDRVKYIHQKIGAAQAQGALSQIGNAFSNSYQVQQKTIDVSDKNEATNVPNETKI